MLLKSISLKNFRQFKNESIDFALGDDGKNVTIIIGEIGTGKTTFAQAFSWCLYGETSFSDKVILNKKVAVDMKPGQEASVEVVLKLRHGELDYSIERSQKYHKDSMGKIKADNTVFNISYKSADGNTNYVKTTLCESEIKKILPKELSNYFFFDGERIEKMSKDISSGKKANDFADAVKGLLGLNGMFAAIQHFNPRSRNSVIGNYDNSYDSGSDTKIANLTKTINDCNAQIESASNRLEEIKEEITSADNRKREKEEELKQYEDSAQLQRDRDILNKNITDARTNRDLVIKNILSEFGSSLDSYFSAYMTREALNLLSKKEFIGKDIPYMHTKTIEYLLGQGKCICGTHLDEGSIPYENLKKLMDFLPPQSISTSISDFKKIAQSRIDKLPDLYKSVADGIETISSQEDDIFGYIEELNRIDEKLSGKDVKEIVNQLNAEVRTCIKSIDRLKDERDSLNRNIGSWDTERKRADDERRQLTLLDDKNKKIEIYKAYATQIYNELLSEYETNESEIREKLEDTINFLFKDIYAGGLSLTIDDKYHITVYADELTTDVETSTAQSISVIFAFISGIIKMARENDNANLATEPYPLVMDAPLSAFDKRRIKTVCETLPRTAEQVIIFIKDTDGDIAEEHMQEKIGSRHGFRKINEFETVLE